MSKKADRKAAKAGKKSARPAIAAPAAHYEAAKPSRFRKFHRDGGSPNTLVEQGAVALRNQARFLERNHDVCRGIVRTLVNNVIGPTGIGIEPQPRRADGTIHEDYAQALRNAWRDWQRRPEVTWRHTWAKAQRMAARVWFRDGEAFAQMLVGAVPYLDHGTRVPFSLELFEPDMVPMEFNDLSRNIRQGIETNAWGRVTGAWLYKQHPGDASVLLKASDLKRIPADRLLHLMRPDRLHQLRGVSEFASIITRIEDIKDYEESERVAAKLAARLAMYVKRNNPDGYNPEHDDRPVNPDGTRAPREIELQAGTIIDSLAMGEEIGLIDTKRPNPNAITWRMGQLRAAAAGIGASYSSIARDYDGTYSAQRQELVEQWVHYAVLTDEFTGMFVRPVWENFVVAADLSGVVPMPRDVIPESADDTLFIGQSMPWIDPLKEASAWLALVRAGFASEVEVMRKRGSNPRDVLEQINSWRQLVNDKGLVFDSDAAKASKSGTAQDYMRVREGLAADSSDAEDDAERKSGSSPKNRTRNRAKFAAKEIV